MITPAISRFGRSMPDDWASERSPLCSVYMSVSVVIRFGHRYEFQLLRNAIAASAAIVGRTSGTATWRRKPRWPTPSMAAASRRSRGSVRKTWRMRNVPNAVARNGTVRPWYVLSQPSESTVRRLTTSVASSGTSIVARNSDEHDVAARATRGSRRRTPTAPR